MSTGTISAVAGTEANGKQIPKGSGSVVGTMTGRKATKVSYRKGRVLVRLPQKADTLAMSPEEARDLAAMLTDYADKAT